MVREEDSDDEKRKRQVDNRKKAGKIKTQQESIDQDGHKVQRQQSMKPGGKTPTSGKPGGPPNKPGFPPNKPGGLPIKQGGPQGKPGGPPGKPGGPQGKPGGPPNKGKPPPKKMDSGSDSDSEDEAPKKGKPPPKGKGKQPPPKTGEEPRFATRVGHFLPYEEVYSRLLYTSQVTPIDDKVYSLVWLHV